MREIIIDKNDDNQRLDRFLGKYLNKAPASLIQKFIRKKRIKVNKKRADPKLMLKEGDIINIYIYDEVLEEYIERHEYDSEDYNIELIYDDDNISIVYKDTGILTHPASKDDYGDTLVDEYIKMLIAKKEYIPRIEKSFTPAFANRLDRNTSGILIACKNHDSLKAINASIKKKGIKRKYRTIVYGNISEQLVIDKYLIKSDNKNRMNISNEGIEAKTIIRPILNKSGFSLVEAELITGRTHQIRAHLNSIGHPIIGDRKYGRSDINRKFIDIGLNNQYLIAYKLELGNLVDEFEYLNNMKFKLDESKYNEKLEKRLFGGIYEI
ncbi:MAG: RluA family pseudouridine synthase [Tissierellia bacterium]|nr:RluA family pseudouridine synthase [Tissierellia bacterium]